MTAWREHFRRISTGRGRGAPLFSESDVEHLFARNTDNVLRQEKKENFEVHCTRTRPRRHGPVQCSPAAFASRLVRVAFPQDPNLLLPYYYPLAVDPTQQQAGRATPAARPACARHRPAKAMAPTPTPHTRRAGCCCRRHPQFHMGNVRAVRQGLCARAPGGRRHRRTRSQPRRRGTK